MSAETTLCKSCNTFVPTDEMRPVGDSFFCEACFTTLMSSPVNPPAPKLTTLKVEAEERFECFICKDSFSGAPHKSMGAIPFCESCVGGLTSFQAPESIHEPQRRIQPKPEPEVEPYYSRATKRPSGPTFGEFGEKRCSQCERRVLEPNGYELRGEDVWCPMCAREHPLVEGEQQESTEAKPSVAPSIPQAEIPVPATPSSMSPGGHSAPVWLSCDSCGKSLPAAQFQQVEGFHICPPCLTTDRDAALHLAKARHRQEMIGLLNKLNES